MTNTNDPSVNFDMPKNQYSTIKVIGVGGGGSNAVNHMYEEGIKGVDFVVCNTDAQALDASPIQNKIQLGLSLTEGLGAGANPEVGAQSAEESIEEIQKLLENNTKMVFVTAGMGGGTGTGAAPIIARAAKELGILTVGIVTSPFEFEGSQRKKQAEKGIEDLRACVDSLIVINNNKLREVYGNLGFKAGFSKADEVLATAARGIAEVITHHFTTNIDLKDVKTVLADSGSAIMGSGRAQGDNKAIEAIKDALNSPLLDDNNIRGAQNVLLLIISGEEEITLDEISDVSEFVQRESGGQANIILGIGEDVGIGPSIAVTIIATGFLSDRVPAILDKPEVKVVHVLDEDQPVTQDLSDSTPLEEYTSAPVQEPIEYNAAPVGDPFFSESSVMTRSETPEAPEQQTTLFHLEEEEESKPEQPSSLVFTAPETDTPDLEETAAQTHSNLQEDPEPIEPLAAPSDTGEEHFTFIVEDETKEEALLEEEEVNETAISATEQPLSEVESPVEERKVVVLDDLLDFEKTLEEAVSPVMQAEEEPSEPELQIQHHIKTEEEMQSALTETTAPASPFESPISESAQRIAAERRTRLEGFNYRFKNNGSVKEVESIPAYKRQGLDIDTSVRPSQQDKTSGMSIDEDGLKSNNRFLHDNVD
jgi:cell division protein FtsZ